MTCFLIPRRGFRIRSMATAVLFAEASVADGADFVIVSDGVAYHFVKSGGKLSCYEKRGDLQDPFNPEVMLDDPIKIIYKFRRTINERILQ